MMKKDFNFIKVIAVLNKISEYGLTRILQNSKIHIAGFWIILCAFAVIIYRLNMYTPWVVDDLCKGYGVQNFHSLSDWFNHIYSFYFGWGGRIWGELYALLFLSLPKNVFNILNTIGYIILIILIYINVLGKRKISISILVYIHFALFACLPAFGQDILWISGCANYMWSSLIPLLFLGIWRIYEIKYQHVYDNPVFISVIFLLGLLTGWANENVSIAIVILLIGYMILYKKKYQYVPIFSIVGFISTIIGSILLWLAPGNFARFAAEKHSTSIFKIINTMIHNVMSLFDFNTALLLFICFAILLVMGKSENKKLACLFIAGAIVSAVAMGVVGGLHSRVFFSCIVFIIIAVGILYEDWNYSVPIRNLKALITVLLILGSYQFSSYAKSAIVDYNNRWNENVRIIQMEKSRGNLDIIVNPITPKNRFCAAYLLDDIKPASNNKHWLNTGVARYYGLNSIQSIKLSDSEK